VPWEGYDCVKWYQSGNISFLFVAEKEIHHAAEKREIVT
jgi:hypothetical protein